MGLVLKHAQSTSAGTLHYRRKVPLDLRPVVGKGEFKRLLGKTQREALAAYPKVNAEFERLMADARARLSGSSPSGRASIRTSLDAFFEARVALAEAEEALQRLNPDEAARQRELHADSILDRHDTDPATGDSINAPEVDRLLANALRNGGRIERPAPTLEDAKRLYLRDRVTGDTRETEKASRVERVMGHLEAALGKGRTLASLERWDAREVRDRMLVDGGMNPATVRRYMNDIRAMVTYGIREFGLRGVDNPFDRLPIKLETVARDERKPFSQAQLKAVGDRVAANAAPDLSRIWRMLAGTGCRLGEVAGLLSGDVVLDHKQPHLNLVFHPHRRLKNIASVRLVPLVGDALVAAKEAAVDAGDSAFLFAKYARTRGPDAASQALMKHVRAVVDDPKIVVHSLRHSMEDSLIRANVSEFDRNLVLGHSQGGMGERYGGAAARLEAAARALKAVERGSRKSAARPSTA